MGKEIRWILSSIANSLNADGYYNVVTPTKKIGEIIQGTNSKRLKSSRRISKVTDANIKQLTRAY